MSKSEILGSVPGSWGQSETTPAHGDRGRQQAWPEEVGFCHHWGRPELFSWLWLALSLILATGKKQLDRNSVSQMNMKHKTELLALASRTRAAEVATPVERGMMFRASLLFPPLLRLFQPSLKISPLFHPLHSHSEEPAPRRAIIGLPKVA